MRFILTILSAYTNTWYLQRMYLLYSVRMKERAIAAENELELTRAQSQSALEAEQDRCHDEVSRVRKTSAEAATEASRRNSAQSAEISALKVRTI